MPEAATLAAMARGASYYNPFRHPDRVRDRRNWVLGMMRQNGYIDDREYAVAEETPLIVARGAAESSDAPYFVDMLNDELNKRFPDYDFKAHADQIYSALDLDLQRAASEAVPIGMKEVDDLVQAEALQECAVRRAAGGADCVGSAYRPDQSAGGRPELWSSQLNRILAERLPDRSSSRLFTRRR